MKVKSSLTGVEYEPSNKEYIFIGNVKQIAAYLSADEGIWDDLVDIIVSQKKQSNELAFVFKRTERLRDLYNRWNERSL